MRIALRWLLIGAPLALLYLGLVARQHRGKVVAGGDATGYERS